MRLASVELHQAFVWTCDDCGRDNFERSVVYEPLASEKDEHLRLLHGLGADESIPETLDCDLVTAPDRVACSHCGARFDVDFGGL